MTTNIIVNGRSYLIPELTFNSMCQLEEMGVSLLDRNNNPLSTIRGFVALAVGDMETAGIELQEHILKGENVEYIMDKLDEALKNSRFFQAMLREKVPEIQNNNVQEIPSENTEASQS